MLSAISDLFGPIFAKELVEMARRGRYYFSRVIYGCVLLFVLFAIYQTEQILLRAGVSVRSLSQMAEDFFLAVLWVQYCSVLFFVPLFLCGVIAGEREQKTLELLFTSDLSNREIVFGKLGSRVVAVMVLVLTGLPVIALTMLFGGVNPTVLWQASLATLVTIVFASALSIYFSATTRTPLGALIRTYWWGMLWLFGLPYVCRLLLLAFFPGDWAFQQEAFVYLMLVNPLTSFTAAVYPSAFIGFWGFSGSWLLGKLIIGPLVLSIFLLLLTIRTVRRDPAPARWRRWLKNVFVRKRQPSPLSPGWRGVRGEGEEGRVTEPPARPPPRRWFDPERWFLVFTVRNPLWLRARRALVYDRERHLRRMQSGGWLLAIIVIILMGFISPQDLYHEDTSMIFHAFAWFGFMLLISLLAGFSIMGERRRGFFELVLATPMMPGEIINGTFLAIWRHVASSYRLLIALGIFFAITGAAYFSGVLVSLITGTMVMSLMVLHGMACSLSARSIPGAMIGTFLFPLITLVGTMMLAGFAEHAHGPILWVLCALLLPTFWILTCFRPNVAFVSLFLIMVHLSIASLFSFWTYFAEKTPYTSNREYPMSAMHAAYITISALEHNEYPWRREQAHIWRQSLVLFWIALGINIVWVHWWLRYNFDRLCGREMPRRAKRDQGSEVN